MFMLSHFPDISGQMRLNTGEGMTYTRLFVVNLAFVFNIMNFSAPEVTYNTTWTQIITHQNMLPDPGTTPLIGCCRDQRSCYHYNSSPAVLLTAAVMTRQTVN